jgi:hypothetical protein
MSDAKVKESTEKNILKGEAQIRKKTRNGKNF